MWDATSPICWGCAILGSWLKFPGTCCKCQVVWYWFVNARVCLTCKGPSCVCSCEAIAQLCPSFLRLLWVSQIGGACCSKVIPVRWSSLQYACRSLWCKEDAQVAVLVTVVAHICNNLAKRFLELARFDKGLYPGNSRSIGATRHTQVEAWTVFSGLDYRDLTLCFHGVQCCIYCSKLNYTAGP